MELPASAGPLLLALLLAAAGGFLLLRRRGQGGSSKATIPSPFLPFPFSDFVWEVLKLGRAPNLGLLHARHGPLFWWSFFGRRCVCVGGYDLVKTVLHAEHDSVEASYSTSVRALLGRWALINVTGAEHVRLRKLMGVAFTPAAIRGYLPRIQEAAEEGVRRWAEAGQISGYREMKWYTLRVAVEMIVGFDGSWVAPENFPWVMALFRDWTEGLFSFPVDLPGTRYRRALAARRGLLAAINASLDKVQEKQAQHVQQGEEPGPSPPSALDLLLKSRDEEGNPLSREQLQDMVLLMLFAGHDTAASTLTRSLHYLHAAPDVVQRLREEQAKVISEHGPAITDAALHAMSLADAVAREVLRLDTPVGGLTRMALRDFELGGHAIAAGTNLNCNLRGTTLHDPRWTGDDVAAFRPDRWLAPDGGRAGTWIPFGGGPRLCLGWQLAMAEMKLLTAVIMRGYSFTLLEPEEPWVFFPLPRPKHGMPLRFEALSRGLQS